MEQGLGLDELLEMKTSFEREAQEESGGDQSPPTAGAARRAPVPPSSELSDGEGVAARRRVVSLRKLGNTAEAEAPR